MREQEITNQESEILTTREAGQLLKLSRRTLEMYRLRGGGPRYHQISSRCIRYKKAEVLAWFEKRGRCNTSDDGMVAESNQ